VPNTYVTDDGIKLSVWIRSLRSRRMRRSAAQQAQLDELGMVWDPFEADWLRGLSAARAFYDQYGNLDVPAGFVTADGFGLAAWLAQQRSSNRSGKLRQERRAELDKLQIDWEPLESRSMRGLASARRYHHVHGHFRVPVNYVDEDGFALGQWLSRARYRHRRGSLPPNVVRELDELGVVWDVHGDEWERGIAAARAYREKRGDLRVPARFRTDDGFPLGQWISVRRLNRDRLSAARIHQLDALGMVWDPWGDGWAKGMSEARSFSKSHGHLRVPRSHVTPDGFKLGAWVAERRQAGTRGRLSEERRAELGALGMV
jgi:hypothetical protein